MMPLACSDAMMKFHFSLEWQLRTHLRTYMFHFISQLTVSLAEGQGEVSVQFTMAAKNSFKDVLIPRHLSEVSQVVLLFILNRPSGNA